MSCNIELICPDCRSKLQHDSRGYNCLACGSSFEILDENIIDLLPKHNKAGDEIIYRHSDYKSQFPYLSEIRNYFYTKKLAAWSMSWGHKNLIRLIGGNVNRTQVDLGIGRGDHYDYVDDKNSLIGVDYDADAMRDIRKKGIDAPLVRADITRLPFPDQSFDVVTSTNAFEHFYYIEVCIEEIYRILKNDGVLAVSFPIVGGWLMDTLSRFGPQREFKRRYGLNWDKVLKVEHCNTSRYILEAVRRLFIIKKIIWSPFVISSHNLNMFVTFQAYKNLEFI
ncbi:MAG: class I SAM-dependent methyltransferase [Nitrospirae bacterium]|nr:class I SAM-dependent methyltransferase [Nitrospirota bacterium]